MNELAKVYQEIAMERDHICTGCTTKQSLSHSHLVPKGQNAKLKLVKLNIVYHCLSRGEIKGCHTIWESIEFWTLDDAHANMKYVFSADQQYFWLKLNHAIDSYTLVKNKFYNLPMNEMNAKARDQFKQSLDALKALELLKKIAA